MSDSEEHTPIQIAESVLSPTDAVLGEVVEALRQTGAIRENEVVTEMDLEIRVDEQIRVTDYTAVHASERDE